MSDHSGAFRLVTVDGITHNAADLDRIAQLEAERQGWLKAAEEERLENMDFRDRIAQLEADLKEAKHKRDWYKGCAEHGDRRIDQLEAENQRLERAAKDVVRLHRDNPYYLPEAIEALRKAIPYNPPTTEE